ncbi:MAG: DUF1800 family protein [Saprospiraceae bacterium]
MVLTATVAGLTPYQGSFGQAEANHLLRRTTFAVSQARVNEAINKGLEGSLDELLKTPGDFGEPLNPYFTEDPNVAIGETWINAPSLEDVSVNAYRGQSLQGYIMRHMQEGGFSISGRMWLFWHNHFAVTRTGERRIVYKYYKLLHDHCIGNFRSLIKEITVDPSMLSFLNGNQNKAGNPNENYGRELLELFTLGKGDQVASGDYTTYTEDDIRALANALTGWQTRYFNQTDPALQPESYFNSNRHDPAPRQLSHRFDNKMLTVAGEDAYKEVVDTIFDHPQSAHYLCRKLYRWFVFYDIDATVEAEIITPMAQALRDNDFEVEPVIRLLLGSEHFFDVRHRGALIKNPIDYIADMTTGLGFIPDPDILLTYGFYRRLNVEAAEQLLPLENPPSVAGYPAWHQAPQYNRIWINASTLSSKTEFVGFVTNNGIFHDGNRVRPDFITYIEDFDNATDPNDLIDEMGLRIIGEPLATAQVEALKEILIPGLPDFEWTVEYSDYLSNPDDMDMRNAVARKLDAVVSALLSSPEFHLY